MGPYKLSTIEVDPRRKLGRYVSLAENPIYYYGALQYCGGSFYRAALGYETLWDVETEAKLMLCLDYLMSKHELAGHYYIEEIKCNGTMTMHGLPWKRGIMPEHFQFHLLYPFKLNWGESITARVNLLDKPNHVDLERANGEVFSITLMRYLDYVNKGTFSLKKGKLKNEQKYPKGPASGYKGSKRPSLSVVGGTRCKDPVRKTAVKLPPLRKIF